MSITRIGSVAAGPCAWSANQYVAGCRYLKPRPRNPDPPLRSAPMQSIFGRSGVIHFMIYSPRNMLGKPSTTRLYRNRCSCRSGEASSICVA